jgi:hypothetical protein
MDVNCGYVVCTKDYDKDDYHSKSIKLRKTLCTVSHLISLPKRRVDRRVGV